MVIKKRAMVPPERYCLFIGSSGDRPATLANSHSRSIQQEVILPAVEAVELEVLGVDDCSALVEADGVSMDRLMLAHLAIVDLTIVDPNVVFALGVRHAARPCGTIALVAKGAPWPPELPYTRSVPYEIDENGHIVDPLTTVAVLKEALEEALLPHEEWPLFQLLDGVAPPDISRLKTDEFRRRVDYSQTIKRRLANARQARSGLMQVRAIKSELEPIARCESAVAIDLLLSFRALEAWDDMVALIDEMDRALQGAVMVQEQLALALNRAKRHEEAELILLELIETRGMSSESGGILGRIYKDQWWDAVQAGRPAEAQAWLRKAIDAYRRGFEVDWRDAYPGVNALSLMEFSEPPDPIRRELFPVVMYAVQRRVAVGRSDFWDWATLLELAVLSEDRDAARHALAQTLIKIREAWEARSLINKLQMIREVRKCRGLATDWIHELERDLGEDGRFN